MYICDSVFMCVTSSTFSLPFSFLHFFTNELILTLSPDHCFPAQLRACGDGGTGHPSGCTGPICSLHCRLLDPRDATGRPQWTGIRQTGLVQTSGTGEEENFNHLHCKFNHHHCKFNHRHCKFNHHHCNFNHHQCNSNHHHCKLNHHQCKFNHHQCNSNHHHCKFNHHHCKSNHHHCTVSPTITTVSPTIITVL